ncbi:MULTISPECIES: hypothetical protein [Leclercia]|nr:MULTISPECIES: hypothetical protein [Leclercia]
MKEKVIILKDNKKGDGGVVKKRLNLPLGSVKILPGACAPLP